MTKAIWQLDPAGSISLTDKLETSQVDSPSVTSVYTTQQDVLNLMEANIAGAPYVTGDLVVATSTTTLGRVADIAVDNALITGGVGAEPTYGKITYAHMQTEGAASLLGNPTGSTGAVSEITLGDGLSFSGTTLVATATDDLNLQDAYDNGVSPNQGSINLNANNLNPIITYSTYVSGDFEPHINNISSQ